MQRRAEVWTSPAELPLAPVLAQAPVRFGHVVTVSGCEAVVVLENPPSGLGPRPRVEIGSLARIDTASNGAIGIVSALRSTTPGTEGKNGEETLAQISLVGEIVTDSPRQRRYFHKGVAHFPTIGDPVFFTDRDDHATVYIQPGAATIDVGALYQDAGVPARLLADDLFAKHFIIVGATGCGKSSALTCILQRTLTGRDQAHVLVLDMHGEYQAAFADAAEVIRPANLHLPFWLLNFHELCTVLTSPEDNRDAQIDILSEGILAAKRRYSDYQTGRIRKPYESPAGLTVDTPTPFRLSDVVAHIEDQMGKLERQHPSIAYRRVKTRIETMVTDARFAFMFGSASIEDTMAEVLGRMFRVPNDGRPITVIDLSPIPSDILDVVISLVSRLVFDLAVWSEGGLPILLVCEEAHRYAPVEGTNGFVPTRQALARIAKEGRKYGISLALVTQRPSDLDTTTLSQCGTLIAMRLSTERDQAVIRANAHEGTFHLLDYLPLLGDREAIVLGQGVPMPMRIRFHDLPDWALPGTQLEGMSDRWSKPNMDRQKLEEAVHRWRSAGRGRV